MKSGILKCAVCPVRHPGKHAAFAITDVQVQTCQGKSTTDRI